MKQSKQKSGKFNKFVIVFAYIAIVMGGLSTFNQIFTWGFAGTKYEIWSMVFNIGILIWGVYEIKNRIGKKILDSAGAWISLVILGLLIYGNINANKDSVALSANDIAMEIKSQMEIPMQIDEITTATDITSEENSIRFHFLVNDPEDFEFSEESINKFGKAIACQDEGVRPGLEEGINLEFYYTLENSNKTYLIVVSEEDCL